jgi:transcriptional regulator with GAF, ATPase, and Fis domain
MPPFLDSASIPGETEDKSGEYAQREQRTDQNKLLMLYKVSDVLAENLPVRVTCRKILDQILGLLKRIDRGVFVLIDPVTKEITETISKPDNIVGNMALSYLRTIIQRVGSYGKPLVVSNVQMEKDELADMLKKLKIESLLCVPMCSKSEIQGFLYIDSLKTPYSFRLDDVSLFMDLCQRIALANQYARIASDREEQDILNKAQPFLVQGYNTVE